ncbi:urease accessory protein UreF [Opitutales bacterium ASA1]|uniref:urease accessory protein UreF n=1 Tax=Congregicoccus parvus TaxID=3081749 RepID=UPI002B2916C7|nr:urease accessory protein UreF [Opitutales bacterium ASA1]
MPAPRTDEREFAATANPDWIARLLHASDSFYPTGSYAHSFGLEGLVQTGVVHDRATLRTFLLEEAVPALVGTDLAVAAQATAALRADPVAWKTVRELCFLGAALRGTREMRAASEAIGSQRITLAAMLHGGCAAEFDLRAREGAWPRPACVAAAIEGAAIGAPGDAVLAGLLYSNVAGVISAAVKLLRLGQNAVHTLLAEMLALTPDTIARARALPLEAIGTFNPWWDVASARHEHAEFRLFIS